MGYYETMCVEVVMLLPSMLILEIFIGFRDSFNEEALPVNQNMYTYTISTCKILIEVIIA